MTEDRLFSIGQAANLCGVSAKALRYYESLELIQPKLVSQETGYRYYDKETLLLIPVIKYYQQVGLDLKQIKRLISLAGCSNHYHLLKERREEIKAKREELLVSLASVDDWLQLIIEGEMCLQNQAQINAGLASQVISLKYYHEERNYCKIEQLYKYNYKESIINLEWTKFLKDRQLEVSGPVILKYDSYQEKMTGQSKTATILQHCYPESSDFSSFGGFMALSSYHIGPLDKIEETYQKMVDYANACHHTLKSECYERYVIDYWVTQNSNEFVTEIIIPTVTHNEILH
ncbi:MerR family transcriptional regulator [Streptococcus marmotae]|uniref:MerR family transcriptional regulator n=1 Tax=Streptococcus marmotae TaxID=1825069 RepID=UPI000834A0C6|nr:MerR family transcriptional regulator [Streptococcus marmotae]